MSTPGNENWTIAKRVFKYLHNNVDYEICYGGELESNKEINIHGFVDSDWVGDIDHICLTNIYVFKIFDRAISRMSKRQSVVALSTTET